MYVLVVPSALSFGVVESQVVGMAKGLHSGNDLIVVFLGKNSTEVMSRFQAQYPDIKFASGFSWLLNKRKLAKQIYSRSLFHYIFLYIFRFLFSMQCKLHYDFRGLLSEESFLRNNNKLRFFVLSGLEKFTFKTADNLYAVSNRMKDFLISKYHVCREVKVIPCCINSSEIISKTNFVSTAACIRFIYVGSMSKWQSFDKVCEIFRELEKSLPAHLTVVTRDKDSAVSQLNRSKVENYEIKSGDREFVLKELSLADFGFIYRVDNIVNQTASPIKFLEYTSQGVIPLITGSVGDYSTIAAKAGISISLDNEVAHLVENIKNMLGDVKVLSLLEEFSSNYTWNEYT